MNNGFNMKREKDLIADESDHLIERMLDYADKRCLERWWALEQFRNAINRKIKEYNE